jgi:hypothetical protein
LETQRILGSQREIEMKRKIWKKEKDKEKKERKEKGKPQPFEEAPYNLVWMEKGEERRP